MNRYFITICILVLSLSGIAQDSTRHHTIGFSVGANYSGASWMGNSSSEFLLSQYKKGTGYALRPAAALSYQFYTSKGLILTTGLGWMATGYNMQLEQGNSKWYLRTRYNYLSLPLGVGTEWKFGEGKSALKLVGGLYALVKLSAKTKLSIDDKTFQNPLHYTEEISSGGFGAFVRLGWVRYINENYSFEIECQYSQNLSQTTQTPVYSFLHNTALMLTLNKRLKNL